MDKYEYKLRSEEIRTLVERNEFADAAAIADTIDWRRVKSVTTLCFISEIYKRNRRYTDARDLLLLAYEKRPNGRNICYALCELSIKLEEFVQAVEYYKEFVQIAPKDPARFILQYKLYELQDINLEERIEVLNEYKKYEYQEKWAYELAYLYHRVGMETRCVEECDELILWFGEGKYVYKAMELKMMHQPLTREQQAKYDRRFNTGSMAVQAVQAAVETPAEQPLAEQPPVEQTTVEQPIVEQAYVEEAPVDQYAAQDVETASITEQAIDSALDAIAQREAMEAEQMGAYDQTPPEITVNVGEYNTIDLQRELAEGLREVMGVQEDPDSAITRMIMEPMMNTQTMSLDQSDTEDIQVPQEEEVQSTEVFFSETGEIRELTTAAMVKDQMRKEMMDTATESVLTAQPPKEMAKVLSQGEDGQIMLVVPDDSEQIEKQITGQMNIEEVLLEWERMRKENEAARAEKTREEILQQTGPIFLQFDQEAKDTLLEKIERDEDAPGVVEPVDEYDAILAQEAAEAAEGLEVIPECSVEEATETVEDIEAVEEVEEAEDIEAVEEVEAEDIEVVEEVEEAEDIEVVEEVEEAEDIEAVEEVEEAEDIEAVEEVEEAEDIEAVEEVEEAEDIEAVEEDIEEIEELEEIAEEIPDSEMDQETLEEEASLEGDVEMIPEDETPEDEFSEEETEELAEEPAEVPESVDETDAYFDELAAEITGSYDSDLVEEPVEVEDTEAIEEAEEVEETENYEEVEEVEEAESYEEAEEVEEVEDTESYGEAEEVDEAESYEETEEAEEADATEQPVKKERKTAALSEGEDERRSREARAAGKRRTLTPEEREFFAGFVTSATAREQLAIAIDTISLASYTGNLIVTGDEGMDTMGLIKAILRDVQLGDANFSGKVARITGAAINNKDLRNALQKLNNGAMIVSGASEITDETAMRLHQALQQENDGVIIVLEDTKKAMNALLKRNTFLKETFNARMDMEKLSNDALVEIGKQYAKEQEFSIDELGGLALHTRVQQLQTAEHVVTIAEVKAIVDEAIAHAKKKTPAHFFDVVFGKRFDDDDMIVLTEKDFIRH